MTDSSSGSGVTSGDTDDGSGTGETSGTGDDGSGGATDGGSGTGDDTTSGGGTSDGGTGGGMLCPDAGPTFERLTDPSCSDGMYCETLPDLAVDLSPYLSTLQGPGSPDALADAARQLLEAGWPFGRAIVDGPGPDCAPYWMSLDYDWQNLIGLAVHECGHQWDGGSTYYISAEYTIDQSPDDFFERWEITQDAYHGMIPDAAANDTYFDPGATTSDQGIRTMYDEWAQYVHSVALDYLLYRDSPRDFYVELMLNFAWAAPRYFLWARDHHPSDYAAMMASEDVREATLVLWGQTLLYYDAMDANTDWDPGTEETRYLDAIEVPALLDMMNEVRLAHGCDGI